MTAGSPDGHGIGEGGRSSAVSSRGVAGATADQAERLGSLTEADAIPPEVAELAAIWHRLLMPSGLGSWPWCGPREDEAWLGDERSGTPQRFDRQSSSPLAGLNLGAGPSSSGDEPFPAAATRTRALPPPIKIPPQTDSLTGMRAFPTVNPKRGDVPSAERSSEEESIEPAKHQKNLPALLHCAW